jgi:hypothetical protein
MSLPSEQELIELARLIYVERLSHLGPAHWDFRPVAKLALSAAEEFYTVISNEMPVSTDQIIRMPVIPTDNIETPPPPGEPTPVDTPAVPVGTEPIPPATTEVVPEVSQPSQTQTQAAPVHPDVPGMQLPLSQPVPSP